MQVRSAGIGRTTDAQADDLIAALGGEKPSDRDRADEFHRVAAEQISRGRLTFADELAEPDFGKARREVGRNPDGTDGLKLAEQVADMSGFRRARHRLQPGERSSTEFGIDDRQPVEFGQLLVGETGKQRVRRPRARPAAPVRSITAKAGRMSEAIDTTTPGGRQVFHIFGALGQFERDLIRERTRAGLVAAVARGRKGGRAGARGDRGQASPSKGVARPGAHSP